MEGWMIKGDNLRCNTEVGLNGIPEKSHAGGDYLDSIYREETEIRVKPNTSS